MADKEYIERRALWKSIEDNQHLPLPRVINEAPVVDVVEVIRCKDCKYGAISFNGYGEESRRLCNRIGKDVSVPANFYCGFGERKNDKE